VIHRGEARAADLEDLAIHQGNRRLGRARHEDVRGARAVQSFDPGKQILAAR
jgi:hypothetical protein